MIENFFQFHEQSLQFPGIPVHLLPLHQNVVDNHSFHVKNANDIQLQLLIPTCAHFYV